MLYRVASHVRTFLPYTLETKYGRVASYGTCASRLIRSGIIQTVALTQIKHSHGVCLHASSQYDGVSFFWPGNFSPAPCCLVDGSWSGTNIKACVYYYDLQIAKRQQSTWRITDDTFKASDCVFLAQKWSPPISSDRSIVKTQLGRRVGLVARSVCRCSSHWQQRALKHYIMLL